MFWLTWFILALVVGFIGERRKIGFWSAFLLSLLLSPLIGGIFALVSKSKQQAAYEAAMYKQQQAQTAALEEMKNAPKANIADELDRLRAMMEAGTITAEEYEAGKKKILGQG
jgi:hypothetical protein